MGAGPGSVATVLPNLGHALPLASEASWSNLLASLIETDPQPLWPVLGIEPCEAPIVRREVGVGKAGRIDLVIESGSNPVAVIEVKVLSGLGYRQLQRYEEAMPGARRYAAVHPGTLRVDVSVTPNWKAVSWETLLTGFARSADHWVATTARAWLAHLERSLPKVDGATVWNDLESGEGFVVQMWTRFSWLHSRITPPPDVKSRLGWSSAGVSATFGLRKPAEAERYTAQAEVEERLSVRDYPKLAGYGKPPVGPSLWVGLLLADVTTSADFDWAYLRQVWDEAIASSRTDWVTRAPRPKGHDKMSYDAMVAAGGPRHLGFGFGAGQVRLSGSCMFGARVQLQPTITLEQVAVEMEALVPVVEAMAAVERPQQF